MKRCPKFIRLASGTLVVFSLLYACAPAPANVPLTLDIEPFMQMTENAACADIRNQLYVIDDQYVFWTTEGHCDDAGYAHFLYGGTPDEKLCYLEDSFVGPLSACEAGLEALFETILSNLDQPDLGLGGEHTVIEIQPDQE